MLPKRSLCMSQIGLYCPRLHELAKVTHTEISWKAKVTQSKTAY